MTLHQKYLAAKAATHAAEMACAIADGQRKPDSVVRALQAEVDAAWVARKEAFRIWIESGEEAGEE